METTWAAALSGFPVETKQRGVLQCEPSVLAWEKRCVDATQNANYNYYMHKTLTMLTSFFFYEFFFVTKSWQNCMWKKSQKMWWVLWVIYKTKTCFLLAWKICTIISELCVICVRTLCPHYSLRLEKGNPRNTYATGSVISYIRSCHWTLHPNLISAGSKATVLGSLGTSDVTGCECKHLHCITVHQLQM